MKFLATLLAAAAMLAAGAADDPNRFEPRTSEPYAIRGGLPNFYRKLHDGKDVRIAYFGGSITAQNGWRVQSLDYFRKLFQNAEISQINAAIGGTGSDLGVFRLDADVLAHKPDLVFVEFAVNDAGARPLNIRRSMEGIVRQIWKRFPETDICFVYTVTAASVNDFKNGKLPRSASVMEEIADHYAIPTVNMSYEVARLEKEGKLTMKDARQVMTRVSGDELNVESKIPTGEDGKIPFAGDGVHPYTNTGHVIYTQSLMRALPVIGKAGTPGPHPLPAPLRADCWDNTSAVPLNAPGITLNGPYTELPATDPAARQFANRLPALWRFEPGASIEFKFKGTKAMLYDLYGPDSAMIEVTVDGKSRRLRRMDGYCTYRRLALCPLADNLPDEVHTVKITVLPEKFDKREVLFERNRGDFDKSPGKYAPYYYYAGKLFLVGELVK